MLASVLLVNSVSPQRDRGIRGRLSSGPMGPRQRPQLTPTPALPAKPGLFPGEGHPWLPTPVTARLPDACLGQHTCLAGSAARALAHRGCPTWSVPTLRAASAQMKAQKCLPWSPQTPTHLQRQRTAARLPRPPSILFGPIWRYECGCREVQSRLITFLWPETRVVVVCGGGSETEGPEGHHIRLVCLAQRFAIQTLYFS